MPTQEDYFGKSESSSVWKAPTPEKPKEQIKVEEKPKGATVDWNNKPRSYEVTVDVPKSAAQKVDTRMTASELADKAILAPIDFSMFIQNKKEETQHHVPRPGPLCGPGRRRRPLGPRPRGARRVPAR